MPGFKTLPGFRDFYPDDLAVRAYIMRTWRDVARRYGFREYDGPPLEPLELYTEKSGPEIVQQLYNFTDKGGREVALRPEMTPTLARMVGARANGLRKPIKWFAIPQLFRYERQQRGRLREHFQLNLDIVGEDDVAADAELLAAAIDMLRAFGLTEHDFVARVSDRRFLRAVFLGAGVPDERLTLAYNIVDKLEREGPSAIRQRLVDVIGIDATNADRILNALSRTTFEQVADLVLENEWLDPDFRDLKNLFERLRAMGLEAYVQIDLSVVRGLAYYTGTVFELFDRRGELRAICGGGRYNDLLKQISGVNLPALGFGMGDVVLTELLKDRDLLPKMEQSVDYYLLAEDYEFRHLLLRTVHTLRDTGYSVEYSLAPALRNRQFKEASALGARKVVVITAEDVARGSVAVPELSS
ncbi:MAG: histidine--tRNA ligase [Gemmatimonadetes bacterium]|jgi:histidyl-tRNA synthetase|nr:histidine--tRNA ligase [Gemmatimonadota bacterium]MBA3969867.1 histidine--tRNA ligase [Gemmatimonadota bacterium]